MTPPPVELPLPPELARLVEPASELLTQAMGRQDSWEQLSEDGRAAMRVGVEDLFRRALEMADARDH